MSNQGARVRASRWVLALLALSLVAPVLARADGIYVTEDLKHPRDVYFTLKLNEQQIADVEQRRHITLTFGQIRKFNEDYKGDGESLLVLSTRYDSCTCDIPRYALWGTPGEIDIHKATVQAMGIWHPPEKQIEEDDLDVPSFDPKTPDLSLIMDSKSRMFLVRTGTVVTEKDLLTIIAKYGKAWDNGNRRIGGLHLDTPPPIGKAYDMSMWSMIRRILAAARERCVEVSVQGYLTALQRQEFKADPEKDNERPEKCRCK